MQGCTPCVVSRDPISQAWGAPEHSFVLGLGRSPPQNMKNKTKTKTKTIFSLIEWLELLPFLDILFDILIH